MSEKQREDRPYLPLLLSHLSLSLSLPTLFTAMCANLVEQIGTNDRRKAVKAEFIYAFPP